MVVEAVGWHGLFFVCPEEVTSSTGRRVGRVWLREERRKALADAMARRKERADVDAAGSMLTHNPTTR